MRRFYKCYAIAIYRNVPKFVFYVLKYELLNENFSETQKGAILTHILNARLIAISPYLSPYYEGEEPSLDEFIEDSPKLKQTMDLISAEQERHSGFGTDYLL